MRDEGPFRSDLFKGSAYYYESFRPQYPETLFTHLLEQVPGRNRLLDIACGTGQVSVPLSEVFEEVVAIDQESEMIEYAQRLHPNVTWIVGTAEAVEVTGNFDLITVGNAYHRLNRHDVARRAATWLASGGYMAILWSNGPWTGSADWQLDVAQVVERWEQRLADGRVPRGWREAMEDEPTADVLERAGLVYEGTFTFPVILTWTIDSLIGFVYSTSTLNRIVLQDHVREFENDIRQVQVGPFIQHTTAAYELARLPSSYR
jgi:SAM-dependent methyltransferase